MQLSSISLAITRLGRPADPDAAIKALFAAGEVGAWYDPSDLSTMFQDSNGMTPVTADGQTVGLILDKSKELALGPELITNGDFSAGSSGWTTGSEWTVGGGQATLNFVGSYTNMDYVRSFVAGKLYKLTFNIISQSGANGVRCGIIPSSLSANLSGVGLKTVYLIAPTSPTGLRFQGNFNTLNTVIDNISVKEVSGNHAYQATAAARPLYKVTGLCKWNDFDAVDDVLNTTFQSALGSSCTVARGNVGAAPTILTGQTIGTSYANSTDNCGLIIVNRALTGQETTDVTAWLTAKGATS